MTGRITTSGRCLTTAARLKEYVSALRPHPDRQTIATLQQVADGLERGYKLFVKFDRGKNIPRALEKDLLGEFKKLELSVQNIFNLLTTVAFFCFHLEASKDTFLSRLEGATIELSELTRLARKANIFSFSPDTPVFFGLMKEFIRFKSVQAALRQRTEAVMFGQQPLVNVTGSKAQLMLEIRKAGYSMDDLEGAVDFWRDGTIEPPIQDNVVQVSDLVALVKELMG